MNKTQIVDWKTITDFVVDAFVGYGIPRADAEICAAAAIKTFSKKFLKICFKPRYVV